MLDELNPTEVKQTAKYLQIPEPFVKKDFFVTKAIQTLTKIEDDYFKLVFAGGTSLSKAYQLVQRMSEDVDFRVVKKPAAKKLGKESQRKRLRDFRYELVDALKNASFDIPDQAIRVFYEGKFMSIRAAFEDSEKLSYLRPYIAVECFVGELALPASNRNVTTLIKETLGEACKHPSQAISCVSLDETTAEKWVALTRRIANTQIKSRQSDKHLVRHIYDLYHLTESDDLNGNYSTIVKNIIEKDRKQFKKYNSTYSDDPIQTSKAALNNLYADKQWKNHWDYFIEQMVYEKGSPSYQIAIDRLKQLSLEVFETMK